MLIYFLHDLNLVPWNVKQLSSVIGFSHKWSWLVKKLLLVAYKIRYLVFCFLYSGQMARRGDTMEIVLPGNLDSHGSTPSVTTTVTSAMLTMEPTSKSFDLEQIFYVILGLTIFMAVLNVIAAIGLNTSKRYRGQLDLTGQSESLVTEEAEETAI